MGWKKLVFSGMLMFAACVIVLGYGAGWRCYVVVSSSMEPFLKRGSLILTAPAALEDLRKGDVVTFSLGEETVTHRILEIDRKERQIVTKGDQNEQPDFRPVSAEAVIGLVVGILPGAGWALLYIKRYWMLLILAILAGAGMRAFLKRTDGQETRS